MRWSVLVLLFGCDRLLGIEDVHGIHGDGGSGSDSGMPNDGTMPTDGSLFPDTMMMPCTAAPASFATPVANPATDATAFTVADLDGNGKLDIVAAVANSDIVVMFGNGDGTFQSNRTLRVAEPVAADDVLVADIDGDTHADVISWTGGTMSVNFATPGMPQIVGPAMSAPLGISASYVLAGQLIAGGGVELAVTDGTNTKTFVIPDQTAINETATVSGAVVAIADVDGDGHQDLIVRQAGSKIAVAFGKGDGTFGSPVVTHGGVAAVPAKFTPDTHLALIVQGSAGDIDLIPQTAARTFGNEAGVFQHIAFPPDSRFIQAVDVNGDGRPDVAGLGQLVTQCGPPAPPGGVSQPPDQPQVFGVTNPIASLLVDVNKDGKPDALQIDHNQTGVFVSLGQ